MRPFLCCSNFLVFPKVSGAAHLLGPGIGFGKIWSEISQKGIENFLYPG